MRDNLQEDYNTSGLNNALDERDDDLVISYGISILVELSLFSRRCIAARSDIKAVENSEGQTSEFLARNNHDANNSSTVNLAHTVDDHGVDCNGRSS